MLATIRMAVGPARAACAAVRNRAVRGDGERGLTPIELLVVVLLLGVLTAIAIPAFIDQREGAWRAQVESDLRNAARAAEEFADDHGGSFAGLEPAVETDGVVASGTGWDGAGFDGTGGVTIVAAVSDVGFTLTGSHSSIPGRTFTYSSATDGILRRTTIARN
jgi:type IV pilus assembly protein PilA